MDHGGGISTCCVDYLASPLLQILRGLSLKHPRRRNSDCAAPAVEQCFRRCFAVYPRCSRLALEQSTDQIETIAVLSPPLFIFLNSLSISSRPIR